MGVSIMSRYLLVIKSLICFSALLHVFGVIFRFVSIFIGRCGCVYVELRT